MLPLLYMKNMSAKNVSKYLVNFEIITDDYTRIEIIQLLLLNKLKHNIRNQFQNHHTLKTRGPWRPVNNTVIIKCF